MALSRAPLRLPGARRLTPPRAAHHARGSTRAVQKPYRRAPLRRIRPRSRGGRDCGSRHHGARARRVFQGLRHRQPGRCGPMEPAVQQHGLVVSG